MRINSLESQRERNGHRVERCADCVRSRSLLVVEINGKAHLGPAAQLN